MRDHNCFADFTEEISSMIGSEGLNLFINNAGVSPKSTRINFVTPQQMEETFLVNCISPLMLTKAVLPLLKQAAASDPDENFRIPHAAVVNISSILGSLTSNEGERSGGLYPYRCSKVNSRTFNILSDRHIFLCLSILIHTEISNFYRRVGIMTPFFHFFDNIR